ncbi:MAG: hypothetical protein ACRELY_14065 [Polyangiaceae bacterium]
MKSLLSLTLLLAFFSIGCPSAIAPEGKHESACYEDCRARAKSCDDDACAHGCRFILDRLVEREGKNVVTCMASTNACDDPTWADCAAKIGVHADGGPPAPPPRKNPEDQDDDSE